MLLLLSMRNFDSIITREQLREEVLELAKPIDFDQLIRDGILEKSGAWYKVLDFKRLRFKENPGIRDEY